MRGDHFTVGCIHHVPLRPFELRHVKRLAIRSDGRPVAAAFVCLVPNLLARNRFNADHTGDVGDVDMARFRTGANAFDVIGLLALLVFPSRNALHHFVSVVDVVNEHADAAVLFVIAQTRAGGVKQVLLFSVGGRGGR